MSKRRVRPGAEQPETAQAMRPVPAILISLLLVAVAAGAGVAVNWAAASQSQPQGVFAACRTGTQLAPGTFAAPPPMCIDPKKNYGATLTTTKGDFSVVFLTGSTPQTVNNFVVLAEHGFFNGVKFFNAQDWVIQTGDPKGDGRGGPGYYLPPEPPGPSDTWVPGSLGMSRFPDGRISGSQFFILRSTWSGGDPSTVYNHFATITLGFDIASQLDSTDRILSVKVKTK